LYSHNAAEVSALGKAAARAEVQHADRPILGVDHMATRILAGEREDVILEFLTLDGERQVAGCNSTFLE